jgi:hypothetical protein
VRFPFPAGRRALALVTCLATSLGFGSTAFAEQDTASVGAAARSVLEPATAQLAALDRFEGTTRAPQKMLQRNLSRYFAISMVPANADEIGRVLGTAERMSRRAAVDFYRQAEARARAAGRATVGAEQIGAVLAEVLPTRPTPYKEFEIFPEAAHPVLIERVDFQAFHDTGFCWSVLVHLAQTEIQEDPAALPMETEAVRALAAGVNTYGLVLLRLGGRRARLDYAPHLQTRHLRAAGKSIEQLGTDLELEPSRFPVVTNPEPWFVDVTEAVGVEFRHVSSDWLSRFRRYGFTAPSFSGGGVSAGHLDNDAWIDLIVCGGAGCSVFLNRGDGTFVDHTAESGLAVDGEARMAVLADFDNDGRTDVFITYARDSNRIFRNLGDGRFRDMTPASGLDQQGPISGPAVAFDYDNDGLLDLYVGNFGNYLGGESPWSPNNSTNGMPNQLFRNRGAFQFAETSEGAGIGNTGWTQALSHFDYDQDGDQDLYIANDFGPNDLLVNNGDGTFSSSGIATGSDDPFHGMNVGFADLNQDRYADIFVTNIWFWNPTRNELTEANSMLLSEVTADRQVLFKRVEDPEFLQHDTGWSWGSVFLDADNDGDDDLYVVNGFTDYLTFAQYRASPNYPDELYAINNGREPNWFFRNDGGLPIHHVPGSGAEMDRINSRGVSPFDFDGDGDLDMAVSAFHSSLRVFRNDGAPATNHWLSVDLEGDPDRGVNRDAIGAQLIATAPDGFYVWRLRSGGEGYLSMGSPELEMGLGPIPRVDLEVIWPGGERQSHTAVAADQRIRIRQGVSEIEILPAR